ncbi:MAG: TVP38/TMEM64 family protein [Rhodobacteraceae bacterium]|nr:TVP38/TMEM64 family protein [Paracoccaceae bacterium]
MGTVKQPAEGRIKRLLPLIVIGLVALLGYVFLHDFLTFETLSDNRETLIDWRDRNYLLAAVAFIGLYAVVVVFSLPGAAILTLTGGFLFDIFPGSIFCVLGATLGAVGIFMAAKTGLGNLLQEKIKGQKGMMARIDAGLKENEISYLLLMRLVPAIPFFLANLAPAFLGVSLRNYIFTTFFGIMPGAVVYASVGAGLGEVFARGEIPDPGIIFTPNILGPILGLCVLATLPIIIKRFRKAKD